MILFRSEEGEFALEKQTLEMTQFQVSSDLKDIDKARVIVYSKPKDLVETASLHPNACHILYGQTDDKGKFPLQMLKDNGMDRRIDSDNINALMSEISNGFLNHPFSNHREKKTEALKLPPLASQSPAQELEHGPVPTGLAPVHKDLTEYFVTPDNKINFSDFKNNHIVGTSKAVLDFLKYVRKLTKFSKDDILILGENGVGKDLVIKLIQDNSPRVISGKESTTSTIINIAAESSELFMSKLMGHKRGAFTDAKEETVGLLEKFNGGVIGWDEIGDIPKGLEADLLRVFQNRTYSKVGSLDVKKFDIQFVFATNKDMDGDMRLDLYNRITNMVIRIPPLRERKEDIPVLAGYFVDKMNEKYPEFKKEILPETIDYLTKFNWTGNIREMEKTINRAYVYEDSRALTIEAIAQSIKSLDHKPDHTIQSNRQVLIEMEKRQKMEVLETVEAGSTKTSKIAI